MLVTVSPAMAIAAMLSILAYLGLAAAGWGGVPAFLGHPARAAVAAMTVLLTVLALFTGGNLSPGQREDRGNRWVLAAIGVIGLMLAYLPAYCDRRDLWTIDGDAARWSGAVLYGAGGLLRLWPVYVLGRRFSGLVAIQPGHQLVTTGIYRVIRHPSYLGLLIGTLGWALAFRSSVGVGLAALLVVPLVARIRAEETLLRSQFGDEYDVYRARTWRLIPGIY
ncbi:Isoprenylcysteine carboxyl methyltransferase (ICMT) family protein [Aquisphaera giovannonii]|uniref:Isoprenylcysteine carboxyl methyltransferase (ICMT) family protein n=1 Tax=Aquisphaera giovannonii TaxID=406548 RepID=A0A5B9W3D3_9BACT|nr:isoprenylcysteine carboxylmethyltransferase family protein [Aquisphaera giovannonii]QEH34601.1 Isoprenylcysteine carboxyl methyltransferase (ICMT) family protein [Aquisphaera giovannonii]